MSVEDLPTPPAGIDPAPLAPVYAFHMRVTQKDVTGYYYPRWDQAIPVVVYATDRDESFKKCFAMMGEPPRGRGWSWTALIDKIAEVTEVDP